MDICTKFIKVWICFNLLYIQKLTKIVVKGVNSLFKKTSTWNSQNLVNVKIFTKRLIYRFLEFVTIKLSILINSDTTITRSYSVIPVMHLILRFRSNAFMFSWLKSEWRIVFHLFFQPILKTSLLLRLDCECICWKSFGIPIDDFQIENNSKMALVERTVFVFSIYVWDIIMDHDTESWKDYCANRI